MAESFVQVAPDSSGKLLRTETSTQGGNTVHQEVVTLADTSGNLINSGQLAGSIATATVPSGATMLDVGGTASAAAVSVTLTGSGGVTTYIEGFECTVAGGSAAASTTLTITGITNTLTYSVAGVTTGAAQVLVVRFPHPIPATAVNTNIVVATGATAGTAQVTSIAVHGFRM